MRLTKESAGQGKFRVHLDAAVRSATPVTRPDPAAMDAMLGLVRSREVSPGDALSCFKTYFRDGAPDEQFQALLVLQHFLLAEPALAGQLHAELASRRWRERLVALAASPHPEVRPMLISCLTAWSASYRMYDIGMHYQHTLREVAAAGGPFRPAAGYAAQHTGYSAQTTGYSTQHTGYPPHPPPGYPPHAGAYPPPPGHPYGAPHPHPPPHHPHPRPADAASMSAKLSELDRETERLRGCCGGLEAALADYKAGRVPFAALSGALEAGQRVADRVAQLQGQLEGMLGSSDGGDEGLMSRILSHNDTAVAALERWRALANRDLAPEDIPAEPSPAAAAAAAGPAPSPPPPPSALDLLLGDELPSPSATAATAAGAGATWPSAVGAGGLQFGAPAHAAANGFTHGSVGASAGGAPPPASGLEAAAAAGAAAAGLAAAPAVTPASDMEGLRSQVLALSAALEQQRRVHATALEAQEAFHRSELAQVRAQSAARVAELEAQLRQQQLGQPPQLDGGPFAAPPPPQPPSLWGGYPAAPQPLPYSANAFAAPAPPSPAVSSNPFAAATGPSPLSYPSMPLTAAPPPTVPYPAASLPPPAAAAAGPTGAGAGYRPDLMSAFDELAAASSLRPAESLAASAGGGGAGTSAGGAAPPLVPMRPSAGQQPAPPAPAATPAAGAGTGASWVDFGM